MKRILVPLIALSLLTGCFGSKSGVKVGEKSLGTEEVKTVMLGAGKIPVTEHGKELWFATGPIAGTNGTNANGVLQAHYMEDGTHIVTVELNIAMAPKGSRYVAYAVDAAGANPVEVGDLINLTGDVRHRLISERKADLRNHTQIRVDLVPAGKTQGSEVALGSLKERKR